MSYRIRPEVSGVAAPPISESFSWVPEIPHSRPFFTLSQAVPSYPPPRELQDVLACRTAEHETSLYTDILGIAALRDALAEHLREDYAGHIAAEDVAITAGCNQAFCLAIAAIAGAGDNVILPTPYFFNHQMWFDMHGIATRSLPCSPETGMLPGMAAAEALIDAKTKAIVLVTPNNPTGAVYPPDLIHAFYALAKRRGLALIIDETYKDFREAGAPAHALFQESDWRDTFIHLYSFSKVFSLTGYRVGALTASPRLIAEIEKLMDCVAICAPRIAQDAALYGLQHLAGWARENNKTMALRAQALRTAFARPDLRYKLVSCGAYFGYVRHPFAGKSAKFVAIRLAKQHGLLVLPGSMFGADQDDFLRFAFANAEAEWMDEIVTRLIESQD